MLPRAAVTALIRSALRGRQWLDFIHGIKVYHSRHADRYRGPRIAVPQQTANGKASAETDSARFYTPHQSLPLVVRIDRARGAHIFFEKS